MDLASYADLAVDLVNTQRPDGDTLRSLDGLHELLAGHPHLGGRISHRDLDAMRGLRGQLRAVFVSAAGGDEEDAIDRLNTLLIQHPVHPQVSGHDGQRWHLHINEGGSVPDRFAARAAMGLAVTIADRGLERLGVCAADGCGRVFFDTTANRSRRYCSAHCARRGAPSAAAAQRRPARTPVTARAQPRAGG
ncbi:CGNR zinc finger domain-containing protein [Actinomadura parmotrematis]|uniref:CGNR zinc finger domain-containing protein n=1 Tax=Actinomadura parmotrematis TaxID=2864039 RepID=A0ABS7G120_9ACTN|nr:CGNR zinc finger domain-containing protein [Actinomadura parmotrematis]MBW8486241.1 CGNR zinc finger domain-containing protein [Actinomadura parmotrematis]